jgi:hypothetical protein
MLPIDEVFDPVALVILLEQVEKELGRREAVVFLPS